MSTTNTPRMSPLQLQSELERLRKENELLRSAQPQKGGAGSLTFALAPRGGISIYGLQRLPVTLYRPAWLRFLEVMDEFEDFLNSPEVMERASLGPQDPRFLKAKADAAILTEARNRGENIPIARDLVPDAPRHVTRPVLVPSNGGGDFRE